MQKRVIATAIAMLASQATMATSPVSKHLPRSYGSGVSTSAQGARVRPGFEHIADAEMVVKAGPAASTVCADVAGYAKVGWTFFDRWGSFPIRRPAGVEGSVRYCVGQRHMTGHLVQMAYDVIGE